MYKELRTYGSTGDAWASPFLAADLPLLDWVKVASLRMDPRWRALRRHVPRGGTVLDAGCGMGQWAAFLSRQGYHTIGVDFSITMITALQRRYRELEFLRLGGVAVITVPIDSEAHRRSSAAQFARPGAETFFQYFLTPEEISTEVSNAGLELMEPVRPVSRHHAVAYPNLCARLSRLHPLLQRMAGWTLKPTLPFVPWSVNMQLAVARRA